MVIKCYRLYLKRIHLYEKELNLKWETAQAIKFYWDLVEPGVSASAKANKVMDTQARVFKSKWTSCLEIEPFP